MTITNSAFRFLLLLWASCGCWIGLLVHARVLLLRSPSILLLVFVPVAEAFTTTRIAPLRRRHFHQAAHDNNNKDDKDYNNSIRRTRRRFTLSPEVSFSLLFAPKQQRRTSLLRLEATRNRITKEEKEQIVDDDAEKTTKAVTTPIQSKRDKQWLQQCDNLKAFRDEHGHCNVPSSQGSLGPWVQTQRMSFKEGRMRKDRKALLDKLGFVWDWFDDMWQNNYKDLKKFQQLHGHTNIPAENPLQYWTVKQRSEHAAGQLDSNKQELLNDLGFIWEDPESERHERLWLEMYHELVQYKLLKGHVRVPVETSSLGYWVKQQRALYRDGKLLEYREAKLESIGFIWRLQEYMEVDMTTFDKKWMKKYEELVEFREEHGHSNVLVRDSALGKWVNTQRQAFRTNKLRDDRKELLDEIGFEWTLKKLKSDGLWQAKYKELQSYNKEFGSLHVSPTENHGLYIWISRQRQYYQAGRLELKRKAMLDKLGFEWS